MKIQWKKYKKLFWYSLYIFCLFLPSKFTAQNTNLDSLYQESQVDNPPEVKLRKELTYLNYLASSYPDSAITILENKSIHYTEEGFMLGSAHCKSLQSWFLIMRTQYEKAHKLGHEALQVFKDINDSEGIALTLNRIGIANLQFDRLEEARKYMKEALEYFLVLKDSSRIDMCYNNLGIVALQEKDYEKCLELYQKSLHLRILQKSWHWVAFAYFNIGSLYLDLSNIDSASSYLTQSKRTFLTQTQHKSVVPMLYLSLGELEFAKGNFEQSILYGDSALISAKEKGRTEIVNQSTQFLAKAHFKNNSFEEAYLSLQDYLDQKTESDSLNNVVVVSEIEEKYQNAEKEKQLIQLKTDELEARNEAQRFKMILLYISIFILVLGVILAYWFFKKRQEQKLNEASLNAKISDMKLMALRSQMNPHFVFNCINTAQNFVLNSKPDLAYDYLANFAKLLRLVLENSDQSYVSLEDEINQLQLYLELEAIRFDQKFKFEIKVDPSLENGVFEIPSMILQPFVENAIVHGLVNKTKDDGCLSVSLVLENENLHCTIEDNGVGRKKAQEIKMEKKRFYKGAALPNIQERLDILKQKNSTSFHLQITDLYQGDKPSGTKVSLYLPLN